MDFIYFLENTTLNQIITSPSLNVLDVQKFDNINFSNFCPLCEKDTTFNTSINIEDRNAFNLNIGSYRPVEHSGASIDFSKTPRSYFSISQNMFYFNKNKDRYINYSFTLKCSCQQCNVHNTYFLINVQSLTNNNDFTDKEDRFYKDSISDFIISKKGIYPLQDLKLNKSVQKFLDRESSGWYYKANKCLNEGLAIGAFAYFRRIIEKELLHIVEFVKKVNPDKSVEVEELINEYNNGGKKANILYEGILKYLPASLQSLGDNPIKILYKKTSGGLHEYDEERCTELSNSINKLLEFVIEKLYEEREQVSIVKNIIKDLK